MTKYKNKFRRKSEDESQKSEDGRRKTEVGRRKTEVECRMSEVQICDIRYLISYPLYLTLIFSSSQKHN